MSAFVSNVYSGGKIKSGATKQKVEWEFKDDVDTSTIVSVNPSCGCTVTPKVKGRKLVGYYNDDTKPTSIKGTHKTITKSIVVTFKDGEPTMVKNSRGNLVPNSNKRKETVQFHFNVEK